MISRSFQHFNDLVWSEWTEFTSCSASCGEGTTTRTRTCIGGICSRATDADIFETSVCNEIGCEYNTLLLTLGVFLENNLLGLSRWTAWEGCIGSSVCGEGTKRRERYCHHGPPGDTCDGAILTEDNILCSYTCRKLQTMSY